MPPTKTTLPNQLTNDLMAREAEEDEKFGIRLESKGHGFGPWRFRARGSRVLVFDFSRDHGCHFFLVPMSLWERNGAELAREVYESHFLDSRVRIIPRLQEWVHRTERELAVIPPRYGTIPQARPTTGELDDDDEYIDLDQRVADVLGELAPVE